MPEIVRMKGSLVGIKTIATLAMMISAIIMVHSNNVVTCALLPIVEKPLQFKNDGTFKIVQFTDMQ
jgi:hypothetical protein